MFKKILIANRGEIACRIIKTAKKMNIKTVSIFSDSDRNAEHVSISDEILLHWKSDVNDSYLNQKKILKVCKEAKYRCCPSWIWIFVRKCKFADLLKI